MTDIPVILLTGVDLIAVRENYSKVHADDFIVKPFEPEKLLDTINALLNKKSSMQSRMEKKSAIISSR